MPLIESEQTFALTAVIMLIVAFGLLAERRPWGQKLGGPLLLLAVSMAAANLGVIPHSAPVYNDIAGYLVPLAIPLLLLRADFRTIYAESGPMFVAFLVAAAATVVGAFAGAFVIDMGNLEPEIAGTVTASYIGGSLNFVATAEAVGIRDSTIYVAGLSADAVGAVFFLLALMLMPAIGFVRRALPSKYIGHPQAKYSGHPQVAAADEEPAKYSGHPQMVEAGEGPAPVSVPFDLLKIANGLAISLAICAIAGGLTALAGVESLFILVVTALSLLVANVAKPVLRQVSSEFEIGTLFMYIFFVAIGAGANLADVLGSALPILLFILVMVAVHLCLVVLAGRLLKLDLADVMIASNACILGPAPAAALAASKGWKPLIGPGILVGLLGYAVATFIGVALTTVLRVAPG